MWSYRQLLKIIAIIIVNYTDHSVRGPNAYSVKLDIRLIYLIYMAYNRFENPPLWIRAVIVGGIIASKFIL